jgi:hypothetical protein
MECTGDRTKNKKPASRLRHEAGCKELMAERKESVSENAYMRASCTMNHYEVHRAVSLVYYYVRVHENLVAADTGYRLMVEQVRVVVQAASGGK